eukprot:scaffold886_cov317-Prasinococcus_capsulatus_cf.AAC.2
MPRARIGLSATGAASSSTACRRPRGGGADRLAAPSALRADGRLPCCWGNRIQSIDVAVAPFVAGAARRALRAQRPTVGH